MLFSFYFNFYLNFHFNLKFSLAKKRITQKVLLLQKVFVIGTLAKPLAEKEVFFYYKKKIIIIPDCLSRTVQDKQTWRCRVRSNDDKSKQQSFYCFFFTMDARTSAPQLCSLEDCKHYVYLIFE